MMSRWKPTERSTLNAFVGAARSEIDKDERLHELGTLLEEIQHELFDCGSDLCYADPKPDQLKVTEEMARRLEERIDQYSSEAPPIRRFILPGGTPAASALQYLPDGMPAS